MESKYEEITIAFDTTGVKKLFLRMCKLQVARSEIESVGERGGTPEERQRAARAELTACAEALFQHAAQESSEETSEVVQVLVGRLYTHAPTFQEIFPGFTMTNLLYTEARRLHTGRPHIVLTHEQSKPQAVVGPASNISLIGGQGGQGAGVTDREYHGP